ncbi:LLM class flavin-dependent oxidoreductase [Rhizobium puerariae]|uniref:LLM class flavin-dependent oxidoreductase n=1 Tax=Rhizobium puerariae TaxID=1585791 RepID=A0ABV6ADP4_9HYPH
MSRNRQLHIAAFVWAGATSQSWRHPSIRSDCGFDIDYYIRYGQVAEEGLIDALFLADGATFPAGPDEVVQRLSSVSLFEPATLMTAIAAHTSHVGLIYTASSSDNEPSALARQVASLDHISKGRAGWNLVTSYGPGSHHLGLPPDERATRYDRAEEFYEVVTGLWDSFEDDAFIYDKERGIYFDTKKLHRLNHSGKYYTTPGPLKVARPIQGYPVIAQAGASEAGRNLGARTADVIFCNNLSIEDAKAFYKDIKARARSFGRDPDDVKILTGCGVVWGETDEIANARLDEISALFPVEVAVANLQLGLDKHDPDQPFPRDLPPAAFSLGHQNAITAFAIRNNLTIRQTALRLAAANKHRSIAGTARSIADNFQEWLEADACDGIVLMSPYLIEGLSDFVRHVVPELQRRGIYRQAYEGRTLRENLGLKRPENRHVHRQEAAR